MFIARKQEPKQEAAALEDGIETGAVGFDSREGIGLSL